MAKRKPHDGHALSACEELVRFAEHWHRRLSHNVAGDQAAGRLRLNHGALLLRVLEVRGVARDGQLGRVTEGSDCGGVLGEASERFGAVFSIPDITSDYIPVQGFAEFIEALYSPSTTRLLQAAPIEALGQAYEQCLAVSLCAERKASGVYYTPHAIVADVVDQTLAALVGDNPAVEPRSLRVVDPACGAGAFLLGAYDRLLTAQLRYLLAAPTSVQRGRIVRDASCPALSEAERRRVLEECIFGVDLDEYALEVARLSLFLKMLTSDNPRQLDLFTTPGPPAIGVQLIAANSLLTSPMQTDESEPSSNSRVIDWGRQFPGVGTDGFHIVIGNPPWGQKLVDASDELKQQIREEYPSSQGIFDWFRPFVELGVRITRSGGAWGMVLPDIILLKNYESTRRLLLSDLSLTEIEWVGMAFSGATIDAVTIAGRKRRPAADHRVHVVVSESGNEIDHFIWQSDFLGNPRSTFNLSLTKDKRSVLQKLADAPRLGDFFEVHEGIHSGNIRSDLFVDDRVDDSCRELLFGRDELRPYSLRWNGRFVRLSAVPKKRTRERYANVGRIVWHQQDKILVRRTGDRITAAVESHGRFASNNFFLVAPRQAHPLSLRGLCALLNSSFMNWLFRTVEPRKGRAFAEVKIKHLNEFPIPATRQPRGCEALNKLGEMRETINDQDARELDAQIDTAVFDLFGLEANMMGDSNATKALPDRRTA